MMRFQLRRAKPSVTVALIVVLLATLAGCGVSSTPPPSKAAGSGGSSTPPPSKPEDAEQTAASSNALALDLLRGLSRTAGQDNVVIAPLSISALLAMLLQGADGATAEAIAGVLHQDPGSKEGTPFGTLLHYLSRSASDVELNTGNALWTAEGYPLTDQFTTAIREQFGGTADEMDLGSGEAAEAIDDWVKKETNNLIERMSDALGLPDGSAVAVLMNAVYFKGSWTSAFDPDDTRPATFTLASGDEVEVPTMRRNEETLLGEGVGFSMARLTYGEDERFAMDILLPAEGLSAGELVEDLTPEAWQEAAEGLAKGQTILTLPRFELEYTASEELDALLKDLGMSIAYSGGADFSRMSPRSPFLSRTAHKTYIRVDEKGTEAAGVTGAVMRESMPAEFRVDRPFVFGVVETETGAIIFAGAVNDPTG